MTGEHAGRGSMNAQKVPWMVNLDGYGKRRCIYTRTHPYSTLVAQCRTAVLARLIVREHNATLEHRIDAAEAHIAVLEAVMRTIIDAWYRQPDLNSSEGATLIQAAEDVLGQTNG